MVGGLAALSSDCCCGGGNGCCRCTGLCSNVASIEDCESEEVNEYFHSGVPCDPGHEDNCFYPCCAWPVTNITVTIVVAGFIDDITPPDVCPGVEFSCGGLWSYDSCGDGDHLFSSQALCIDGSINATGEAVGVENSCGTCQDSLCPDPPGPPCFQVEELGAGVFVYLDDPTGGGSGRVTASANVILSCSYAIACGAVAFGPEHSEDWTISPSGTYHWIDTYSGSDYNWSVDITVEITSPSCP